jgi:hypothetical protein
MPKFRKKPIVVTGRQLTESEIVLTAHGRVRAEPGDWVLTDPSTGDTWPIKPDILASTYEPIEESPAANPALTARDFGGKMPQPAPPPHLDCIGGENGKISFPQTQH